MRSRLETTLFVLGGLLLLVWGAALAHRTLIGGAQRYVLLAALEARAEPLRDEAVAPHAGLPVPRDPDTSGWALERVAAFVESLARQAPAEPLAVLEIPGLDLSVLVLDGVDEWSLNRGVGRIPGTAEPSSIGNVGIAGHRDGFFRALRHIAPGEIIEWRGPQGLHRYEVDWTRVVAPQDVEVLAPTDHAALTLVTCHPFFFAGPAPERFIVRARRIDPDPGQGTAATAPAAPLASR